jgi:hypothetical protein
MASESTFAIQRPFRTRSIEMTKKVDPKTKQSKPVELSDDQLTEVAGGRKKAAPATPAAPAPMM